jgi:hypothetical protein
MGTPGSPSSHRRVGVLTLAAGWCRPRYASPSRRLRLTMALTDAPALTYTPGHWRPVRETVHLIPQL